MAGLSINQTFSQFIKRAERSTHERLVSTFVGIDNLVAALSSQDHRIIFGRRGTGKTHALMYGAEARRKVGDHTIFIDLRTVGSDQSIYSDQTRSVSERATRLLLDVFAQIHDLLLEIAINRAEEYDLSKTSVHLDKLADAISRTQVIGQVTVKEEKAQEGKASNSSSIGGALRSDGPELSFGAKSSVAVSNKNNRSYSATGEMRYSVVFGDILAPLRDTLSYFGGRRLWIMLDEWSSVPYELQPFLADLIRRCIFPINTITVQIAAIEQRCNFILHGDGGAYVGVELGADASADVNLDDFMVFDNDANRAKNFFGEFLFNHFSVVEGRDESEPVKGGHDLIRKAFTDARAFEEFVRAVEGVPRDAMNIISLAAIKAGNAQISVQMVRVAARDWYQRDKANILAAKPALGELLQWIITEVIEHRRARAFLLRADQKDPMIDDLFDARLLHVLKKSVAAHDKPGVRYSVFKLDYGCYVDLFLTAKAPDGLLAADEDGKFVDVPPDDYRAIRRAILDIGQFKNDQPTSAA